MRRRGPILALAVGLLALPLGADGAEERSACQKLSARDDLAPAENVKLVERTNDAGGKDLVGCVLPDGEIVRVARSGSAGSGGDSYKLRRVAGRHVAVDVNSTTPSAVTRRTSVVDVGSGRRYVVAFRCDPAVCDDDETARRVRINTKGQAAAMITNRTSDLVTVNGYSPRGTRKVLDAGTRDEILIFSLEVDGGVASWINDGVRKSARLPKTTACQKLKARDDLAGARRVKLVERRNEDGGTDLVGCVLPNGKVRVVASRAKMTGSERRYRLLEVEGHVVLVRGTIINQYGRGISTYVYDIKRGRSYNIAETCFDDQGVACRPQTRAVRALVNAQAQSAAIVHTEGATKRYVVGFLSTGESRVLDSGTAAEIPASSLRLDGHQVTWTHSGAPRGATLKG